MKKMLNREIIGKDSVSTLHLQVGLLPRIISFIDG